MINFKNSILVLGKYYPPEAGGIEKTSKILFEALPYPQKIFIAFSKSTQQEKAGQVRKFRAFTFFGQPLSLWYLISAVMVARNSKRIYLHFPNILGAVSCIFARKESSIIIHWHSDVVKQKYIYKLLQPVIQLLLVRANVIIVTTRSYADASSSLKLHQHKIVELFSSTERPKQFTVCDNKSRRLLFVGRLVSYKGLKEFLSLVPTHLFDRFDIVGDGPLLNNIKEIITIRKLTNVYIHTNVSDKSLREFYERATVLTLPSGSRAEAFGLVMVEAFSYGIPAVCFDIPGSGVSTVNRHNISGFVAPHGNYQALFDLIEEAFKKFSTQKSRQQIINYYEINFENDIVLDRYRSIID